MGNKTVEKAIERALIGLFEETDPQEAFNLALAEAIEIGEYEDPDFEPTGTDEERNDHPQIAHATSFESAGVLTSDKGVILTLSNGKRVYLTIQVQDR